MNDLASSCVLPPVSSSAAAARSFIVAAARRWGFGSLVGDLALIVSELVTNAFEHGSGPVNVAMRRCRDGVQVEVTSGTTVRRPERLDPPPSTSAGRGLLVVDALAADWGHHEVEHRRTVWATLTDPPS